MKILNKTDLMFDLDGTIINSQSGIFASVRYALDKMGLPPMSDEQLRPFIGPPLQHSFEKFCGLDYDGSIRAIKKYREFYQTEGVHMYSVYEGLTDTLDALRAAGRRLYVATCKPEHFARLIINESGLRHRFCGIYGVPKDGYSVTKAQVIARVINDNGLSADSCAMIGDTAFDISGAKECGVFSVGVKYGFAAENELENAGAQLLLGSPRDIADAFC